MRGLRSSEEDFDGRAVALLAAIQLLLLILGWCTVAFVLKLQNYPHNPMIRWNPVAVWSRDHAWLLLIAIVVWAVGALTAGHLDTGGIWTGLTGIVGILLVALILILYGYSGVHPGSQRLLAGVPAPALQIRASTGAEGNSDQYPGDRGGHP